MVTRLRHFSVVQFALVVACLYALIGILIGIFWIVISPIMVAGMKSAGQATPGGMAMLAGMGIFAIVFFPIMYFIFGFIGGVIYAALYNLVAGWTGGIEMRLEPVTPGTTVTTVSTV